VALGMLLSPMCLCHQAVQFGTGESWRVNCLWSYDITAYTHVCIITIITVVRLLDPLDLVWSLKACDQDVRIPTISLSPTTPIIPVIKQYVYTDQTTLMRCAPWWRLSVKKQETHQEIR